jgi:RNA-directed DNA polymerase
MTGFNPAISRDALTKIGARVRSWRLHRRTDLSAADLARWVNPNGLALRGVSWLEAVDL